MTTIVAIHDGWLTSDFPRATGTVEAAIVLASREWLQRLGLIYDMLIQYLGGKKSRDREFVDEIKRQWEARVRDEDWPRFAAAPE